MPRIKSAKKALRQNIRRRRKNIVRKNELKEAVKNYSRLLLQKKSAEAAEALQNAYKKLDKMAKIGFIKPGKADRLKSRLAKKLAQSKI